MERINPTQANAFTGGAFDRAAHRREDVEWLEAAVSDPASRFLLFRHGRPMLDPHVEGPPRPLYGARPEGSLPWVFLGLRDLVPVFAIDVSAGTDIADDKFTDMRAIGSVLPADDATLLATGKAMLHWHAQTGFCSVCGGQTVSSRGGYVRRCSQCQTEHFPRSDPAVIMLVTKGQRLLLGQSHKFPVDRNFFSTLAGFVEPGESLEDAVRREVLEEVGIQIGAVSYHSSQPWPFPASLMLGFYAEALNEEIILETSEMRDAKWFTIQDIASRKELGFSLPPHDSIARRLIEDWLSSIN